MHCAGYYSKAAAKSAAGLRIPESHLEPIHALACFFVGKTCTQAFLTVWSFVYMANDNPDSMAVQAGAPSGAPVSKLTGNANPVWAATLVSFASPGGSNNLLNLEDAAMVTTLSTRLPEIRIINGRVVTSSLAIADVFNKRHDNVIRNIQNLECSPEFNALNFEAVKYKDSKGEERPAYRITRDGFTFLAMGFTGKHAAVFKEAYINALSALPHVAVGGITTGAPRF